MSNSRTQDAHASGGNPLPIRVLLVHDHLLAVWAFERLVESTGREFVIVGWAANDAEALRIARESHPDLALIALDTEGATANLLPKLLKIGRLQVIVLATVDDEAAIDRAVVGGARGLLRRRDAPESILKAMRRVHDGELWLDRATSGRIFGLLTNGDAVRGSVAARIARLTARERNIVVMLARQAGARHREVAGLLGVSEHTLRNHLSRIYAKLELNGRFELYLYAKRHGLDRGGTG